MKLLRWTLAGASFFVIYKYSIGKKAKGSNVFDSPEGEQPEAAKPKKGSAKAPKAD